MLLDNTICANFRTLADLLDERIMDLNGEQKKELLGIVRQAFAVVERRQADRRAI